MRYEMLSNCADSVYLVAATPLDVNLLFLV